MGGKQIVGRARPTSTLPCWRNGWKTRTLKSPGHANDFKLNGEEVNRCRALHRKDIMLLNKLADPNSEPPNSVDIELSTERLKLAVMRAVWDEDWGTYNAFEKWINKTGGFGNVPDKYKTALEYYKQE